MICCNANAQVVAIEGMPDRDAMQLFRQPRFPSIQRDWIEQFVTIRPGEFIVRNRMGDEKGRIIPLRRYSTLCRLGFDDGRGWYVQLETESIKTRWRLHGNGSRAVRQGCHREIKGPDT